MMKKSFLDNYELSGVELEIFKYPAPVLKKVAKPVTEFDDELKELVKNMLFTMYHAPGIGLAAPQVGVSKRIFVLDIWYNREKVTLHDGSEEVRLSEFSPLVFINPVFKEKSGEILYEEGCLSVPGIYEEVKRANTVLIEYFDVDGNAHSLEADELLAVCLQHENDHLDGIVFVERLNLLKKQLILKKLTKKNKK